MILKIKDVTYENPIFYLKKQSIFCSTLPRHTNFRASAAPW